MRSRRLHDERGSVLTLFAVGIPTFILLLALALDIGNWYVHKEKLQTRVDDGSFAAALAYGYRFPDCTSDTGLSDEIAYTARQYAGDAGSAGSPMPPAFTPPFNAGINETATTEVRINTLNSGASDGGGPCVYHAANAGDFSNPLGGFWTDVKAKEVNVVSLFGGFGVPVPAISTGSRISLRKIETAFAVQPFAVADPALTDCAWVRFSNSAGSQGPFPLARQAGTNTWTATPNVNKDGNFLAASVELGSCNPTSSQRILYPNVGYVDRFPNNVNATVVRRVELSGSPCNGYYVFRESGSCNISISAEVEFECADPPGPADPVREVYASLGGNEIALTGGPVNWSGSFGATVVGEGSGGDGTLAVTLRRNCNGVFEPLDQHQSVMAGDDLQEGPIASFTLSETSFTNGGGSSFSPTITMVLKPLHSDNDVTVPGPNVGPNVRVVIRGESPDVPGSPPQSGHLSGGVQCGPGGFANASAVEDAIREGCAGPFTSGTSLITMTSGSSGSGSLQGAYNARWCAAPNNWGNYPGIPRGDRRLIIVSITTPGAPFSRDSGDPGKTHTATGFAAFYVTGWQGASCGSPGPGNDDAPVATATGTGRIWGHFIKFVRPPSTGTPRDTGTAETDNCTWNVPGGRNDVEACIATLVR